MADRFQLGDAFPEPRRIDRRRWPQALRSSESDIAAFISGHRHFETDWCISNRQVDQHFLFFVEGGECIGQVDGRPEHARPGSMYWIPPGRQHGFAPVAGADTPTCFHIRFRLLLGERSMSFPGGALVAHDALHLRWLLEQIHDNMCRAQPKRVGRLKALLFYLYSELATESADVQASGGLSPACCRRLAQAVDTGSWHSPRSLAQVAGLSPDYFSRAFRRSFGMSPRRWLLEERIRRGAMLLLDDPSRSIAEVAAMLGYDEMFLFSRQFKQITGRSPSDYRRRNGNLPPQGSK